MTIPPIATTYIDAVHTHLAGLGITPTETWIERDAQLDPPAVTAALDFETDLVNGLHPAWARTLQITWSWLDADSDEEDPEQSAVWQWGELVHGSALYRRHGTLPVADVAQPADVAAAIHTLATTGEPGPQTTTEWEHRAELFAALDQWAAPLR